ncbi:MarR family transcriptional regulator [Streptomyces sp. Tue 6430]|nr:MarR family transcriptional regulator [Streptomyces sp. Tue 6430]
MSMGSEGATPGYLVWRLSTKWRVAVDRAVAPLGLTHAQYTIVASLHGMRRAGEHPSQRRLADHTGLEPLYVSKLARALESAGLIGRTRDPRDPRAVRLALTERGEDVTRRAVTVVHALLERLTEPLGGLDSARTRTFTSELALLLDAPLEPPYDSGADATANEPDNSDSNHSQNQNLSDKGKS